MVSTERIDPYRVLEAFRRDLPADRAEGDIASLSPDVFVGRFSDVFDEDFLRDVHVAALHLAERTTLVWANVKDAVASPFLRNALFNNIDPAFIAQQESIPGYDKLFGPLDQKECDHGASIFGPVAYFVDLMRFADTIIALAGFPVPPGLVPLSARRPDLAEMELDTRTALDPILHIQLVNEVLEALVRTTAQPDALRVLDEATHPVNLPYTDPLARIRAYLETLGTNFAEVYRRFGGGPRTTHPLVGIMDLSAPDAVLPPLDVAREVLGLSPAERALITSPVDIAAVFDPQGIVASVVDDMADVATFQERLGLTDAELSQLVTAGFGASDIDAGLNRGSYVNDVADGLGPLAIVEDDQTKFQVTELVLRRLQGLGTVPADTVLTRLEQMLDQDPLERTAFDTKVRAALAATPPVSEHVVSRIAPLILEHARHPMSTVINASAAKLEHAYQQVKLARATGWGLSDADHALRSLAPAAVLETALQLGGEGHVRVEDVDGLELTELTIEAWIKPTGPGAQVIVCKGNESNSRIHFSFGLDDDGRLVVENSAAGRVTGQHRVPHGVFTHVSATIEGHAVRFYINGQLNDEQVAGLTRAMRSSGTTLLFGRDFGDGSFDGTIKDVRIWSAPRSQEEISANRFRRFTAGERDLVGYWPLTADHWYGAADQIGTNHGNVLPESTASAAWTPERLRLDPLPPSDATTWQADRSPLVFDGSAPLQLENSTGVDIDEAFQQRTVELWFKANDVADADRQVLYDEGGIAPSVDMTIDRAENLCWGEVCGINVHLDRGSLVFASYSTMGGDDPWPGVVLETTGVADGRWHHAAFVVDGRGPGRGSPAFAAYLDGLPVGRAELGPTDPFWVSPSNRAVGGVNAASAMAVADKFPGSAPPNESATHVFSGEIIDVRLWNLARSLGEIRARWFDDALAGQSGLTSQLRDGPTGMRLVDVVGLEADGSRKVVDAIDPKELVTGSRTIDAATRPPTDPPRPPLDARAIRALGEIKRVSDAYRVPVGRLTSSWSGLDRDTAARGGLLIDEVLGANSFIVWDRTARLSPDDDRAIETRLMAGLGLGSSALDALVDAVTDGRSVLPVDRTLLARLDRQATTAGILGVDAEDLRALLDLLELPMIDDVTDFLRLEAVVTWMNERGLDIGSLRGLLGDESRAHTPGFTDADVRETATHLRQQVADFPPPNDSSVSNVILVSSLADLIGADPPLIRDLLAAPSIATPAATVLAWFVEVDEENPLPDELNRYLTRLSRLRAVFSSMRITDSVASMTLQNPEHFSIHRLLQPELHDLDRLRRFEQLVARTDASGDALVRVLDETDPTQLPTLIAAAMDWKVDDVRLLTDAFADQSAEAVDIVDLLHRLDVCFETSAATKVHVGMLLALADTASLDLTVLRHENVKRPPESGQADDHPECLPEAAFTFYDRHAEALLGALRSRHDDADWTTVHQPIRDAIATQRRDALLARTMLRLGDGFGGRRNPDVLFQYLLLDVQTGSAVVTSRVVQAIASVQLYVQRCLMNLEPSVDPSWVDNDVWRWMRNYRVWEANRKVFLYPENYIEPELRDSKSPLFRELEESLMEGEITEAAVERAYVQYLDGFAAVANLKITGSYKYKSSDDPPEEMLYLVGRTDTHPRTYYFREAEVLEGGFRWRPWKKIDLTINSDFVTPVFAFNKLFLFWPEFAKPIGQPGEPQDDDKVETFRPTIKFSFHNLDKRWIQPQTYLELSRDITAVERHFPEWQRVYAQRSAALRPDRAKSESAVGRRVFELNSDPGPTKSVRSNGLENCTWSFWVKFMNEKPNGVASPKATQKQTLFEFVGATEHPIHATLLTAERAEIFRVVATSNAVANQDVVDAIADAERELNDAVDADDAAARAETAASETAEHVAARRFGRAATSAASVESEARTAEPLFPEAVADIRTASTDLRTALTRARAAKATPADLSAPGPLAIRLEAAVGDLRTSTTSRRTADQRTLNASNARPKFKSDQVTLTMERSAEVRVPHPPFGTLDLIMSASGGEPLTALTIGYDEWQHVALTMTHLPSGGYDVKVISNDAETGPVRGLAVSYKITPRNLLFDSAATSVSPALPAGGQVTVGRAPANGEVFKTRMAELRLWDSLRNRELIVAERSQSKTGREPGLLLHLPLDEPVLDTERSHEPASANTTTTAAERRLIEAARERIIIFYGDIRRSMRNNIDDQNFALVAAPEPPGAKRSFDLKISLNTLHVTETVGLPLNGFTTSEQSSLKRFTASSVKFLTENRENLSETEQRHVRPILMDFNTDANPIERNNSLLKNLPKFEASLQDVNNQPGWYVFGSGDEQFLIEAVIEDKTTPEVEKLQTTEERLVLQYARLETATDTQEVAVRFDPDPLLVAAGGVAPAFEYRFHRLSSYAIYDLSERLFKGGVDLLLRLDAQEAAEVEFDGSYDHNEKLVIEPPQFRKGQDTIDFNGPNGHYYWEVFFHIPSLIANRLNAHQRFEEAERWYHHIFDPTSNGATSALARNDKDRYWQFLPFRNVGLETLERMLDDPSAIAEYRDDPFDPHAIARLRLNAYQKSVVMKYVDNLLDWGDALFRRDGRESINEAAMLYVRAYDILGPRPVQRTERRREIAGSYRTITGEQHPVPDFLIASTTPLAPVGSTGPSSPTGHMQFNFCVPENEQFVSYWDRVEDRMFKIRHSLDIEGVARALALFEPPLDPAALVRAVAGGRDVDAAVSGLDAEVPHYRFGAVLERAKAMTANVIGLGAALLAALEKRDAAELADLQTTHQGDTLRLMRQVVAGRRDEADASVAALRTSLVSASNRQSHYQKLIAAELLPVESANLTMMETVVGLKIGATSTTGLSIVGHLLPNTFGLANGGMKFGDAIEAGAKIAHGVADILNQKASMSATVASYERRAQDWKFQETTAEQDVGHIKKQIEAAEIRVKVAEHELANHERDIERNKELEEFHRRKFSNQDLYSWMVARLSSLYFQAYKMAHDLATTAQRAYQYELGSDATFITFGHWDNLKKGLLAGESLQLDLSRMEKTFLEQNERMLEVERTISLLQLDPLALLALKDEGSCTFDLTESLFAHDYPGHYCRQIKSIEITIPAIVGPYQQVKATLTQTRDRTLMAPDIDGARYLLQADGAQEPDESVLRTNWRGNQRVAISRGLNDSGLFQLNFNDERYLPFEGTGAVSSWQLDMPRATNQLDFDTITDVIIHVSYTAKSADGPFSDAVKKEIEFASGFRIISLAHEHPSAWHDFTSSTSASPSMTFQLPENVFPPNLTHGVAIASLTIIAEPGRGTGELKLNTNAGGGAALSFAFDPPQTRENLTYDLTQPWTITCDGDMTELSDLLLVVKFEGRLDWR